MAGLENGRVLVVDDDPAIVEVVGAYLERRDGLTVVTTTDPEDALRRIERGDIACVVSDYEMPDMDGLELLRAVRDRRDDLPFVLFTGAGDEALKRRAREHGAAYVEKGAADQPLATLAARIGT